MEIEKKHKSTIKALERKQKFLGWKTTDEEEIERRRLRASIEPIKIDPLEPGQLFYGSFSTRSQNSTKTYFVEIRSLDGLENSCQCVDYLINGLGTCKHIEAVLAYLSKGRSKLFKEAVKKGSPRIEIYLSRRGLPEIKVAWNNSMSDEAKKLLSPFFSRNNTLLADPLKAIPALKRAISHALQQIQGTIRIARDVEEWVSQLKRREEGILAKEEYLKHLRNGKEAVNFLKHRLYPYQEEGMLHLTFGERAMLADDMGLGKTVQAIGACALLRQFRKIERVLVVCPASLKAEWEDQIFKFTELPTLTIFGPRAQRLKMYRKPSFFYLTNYEQIRSDLIDIGHILAPDVVILDEAQRIKNWQTKTAKAVKCLSSPYAFVLTGTPLENRIDEIYSIIEFLDSHIFGPLFRFNREFYELDEKGRPIGYKNLHSLHRRIRPIMLRRRKDEVEDQLPGRTVNNYFVGMETEQRTRYEEYQERVARLLARIKRRPMTKEEFDMLQRWLACMRMICDTPFILDKDCRICPKLPELGNIIDDIFSSNGNKILIFSEWERMLQLVAGLADEMKINYAWHTGSVPQKKRRDEIKRFKSDPDCRLFISTDSGSVGLNLQEADTVINIDLPWNPARLEQRIARAWRKFQTRAVSIINLVCENSIEHRMLNMLAQKQRLADGVLDGRGDFESIKMPSGKAAFLDRLEQLMGMEIVRHEAHEREPEKELVIREDPYLALRDDIIARLSDRLLLLESCENFEGDNTILAVIDGEIEQMRSLTERLIRERFAGSRSVPTLELMDRTTYETIKRLTKAGFLKSDRNVIRQIHTNAIFSASEMSEKERLHKEAQKVLSQVDRKLRMSSLLANEGFYAEALPALSDAVELSLKASAYLVKDADVINKDMISISFIESHFVSNHLLPENAVAVVASVREYAQNPSDINDEALKGLITSAKDIVQHVDNAMRRLALE